MNNKSSISNLNSPNYRYKKSSDIKIEPTDSDFFSKDQLNHGKQDFDMFQFVKLSSIKVEKTVEEDIDGDLLPKNVPNDTEIKDKKNKSNIVDICDDKSLSTKHSDVEKQELAGISSIKLEKMDESVETDDSLDNINNTNLIEG